MKRSFIVVRVNDSSTSAGKFRQRVAVGRDKDRNIGIGIQWFDAEEYSFAVVAEKSVMTDRVPNRVLPTYRVT